MGKKSSKDLASAFYEGEFLTDEQKKVKAPAAGPGVTFGGGVDSSGRPAAKIRKGGAPNTRTFDDATYEAAVEAGYGAADINKFLRESGIKATGSNFRVAGMGDYQGKRDVFWEVAPLPKAAKVKTATSPISTLSSISATPVTNLLLPDPLTNIRI